MAARETGKYWEIARAEDDPCVNSMTGFGSSRLVLALSSEVKDSLSPIDRESLATFGTLPQDVYQRYFRGTPYVGYRQIRDEVGERLEAQLGRSVTSRRIAQCMSSAANLTCYVHGLVATTDDAIDRAVEEMVENIGGGNTRKAANLFPLK
jgi:hypothetical protein